MQPADVPIQEEARLEDAIRRADQILVSSLRQDEKRRKQRFVAVGLALGGIVMLTAVIIAIVMAVPNSKPASPADRQSAAQITEQATALWQKGQIDDAEAKFAEAVKLDPKNSLAWNGLGWTQFNQGKSDEATKSFDKAVEADPTNAAALNGLGQVYFAQNKLDKAEEYLKKAGDNAPAAWWGLAKIYLLQGKFDDAKTWAQKIIDFGDASAQQLLDAAVAHNVPDALRKQIAPAGASSGGGEVALEVRQAWMLFNKGKAAQAKQAFEAYLKDHPDDPNALNGYGWALLMTAKPADAQKQFEKCLKLDPTAAGAMNGLARAFKAQKKTDEAIKVWEQMVKDVPGVHAGTSGLADAYAERKQYEKAIPLYEQILQENPNDNATARKLAQAKAGLRPSTRPSS